MFCTSGEGSGGKQSQSLQGRLVAGEGCPGEQVILHTEQCWPRMAGQSRQSSIRIFQLGYVLPFSVIYIVLKIEYVYFTGKRVIFPLTPLLCPSRLFLLAHSKWATLWKKYLHYPGICLYLSIQTLTQRSSQKGEKEYLWNGLIAVLPLNMNTAAKRTVMHKASTGASFNLSMFSFLRHTMHDSGVCFAKHIKKKGRRWTKKGSKNGLSSRDNDLW